VGALDEWPLVVRRGAVPQVDAEAALLQVSARFGVQFG
jgi:hypothetical protein